MCVDRRRYLRYALLCYVGLVFGVATAPVAFADTSADLRARVVEVRTTFRNIPHRSPWRRDDLGRSLSPAVYLGKDVLLMLDPHIESAIGAAVRVPDDLEVSAGVLDYDRELHVALLAFDAQSREASPFKGSVPLTAIDQKFAYGRSGQQLNLVGYAADDRTLRNHTVFYSGVGGSMAPGHSRMIPVLRFSGWTAGISRGDLLFSENGRLAGIVLGFNREENEGTALPAALIQEYVRSSLARASEVDEVRPGRLPREGETVLVDSGFRYEALPAETARRYYGLDPDTNGALVTEVLPWMRPLRDRLVEGDVILSIDGRKLSPGATLQDEVLGRLPLGAALGFADGKPVPSGSRVKLRVARDREIRTVEIGLYPFAREFVQVPREYALPPYIIVGGLVLTELSERYVNEGESPAHLKYLAQRSRIAPVPGNRRFVVLDRVLPIEQNRGAYVPGTQRVLVLSLNNIVVRNLAHLRELMIENEREEKDLAFGIEGGGLIVIAHDQLNDADTQVRSVHGIQFLEAGLE